MILEKLKSAIYNNVMSGLSGAAVDAPFTLEQIEDGIVQERMTIIKEYALKNLIPLNDLMYSIRCIKVDCESLDRCVCSPIQRKKLKHIEIPQIFSEFMAESISYAGSTDGQYDYKVYIDETYKNHKFKRRGVDKPYMWVDMTPNKNNMLDAFIFNAEPKEMLLRLIPKDIRQLEKYACCNEALQLDNITFIDTEIEKRLTEKYLRYYRQTAIPPTPNDQTVKK